MNLLVRQVMKMMNERQPQTGAQTSMISTAALVGAIFGQLIFGSLADVIGRRIIFVTTLTLVTFGSLISAFVTDTGAVSIYTWLAVCRFILGFGIGGGERPSAVARLHSSVVFNAV